MFKLAYVKRGKSYIRWVDIEWCFFYFKGDVPSWIGKCFFSKKALFKQKVHRKVILDKGLLENVIPGILTLKESMPPINTVIKSVVIKHEENYWKIVNEDH